MLCISSILGYHSGMQIINELGTLISRFMGLIQGDTRPVDLQTWVVLLVIGMVAGVIISYLLFGRFLVARIRYSANQEVEKARLAERERVQTIYEVISTMTSTLNHRHVLDAALDMGERFSPAETSTSNASSVLYYSFTLLTKVRPNSRLGRLADLRPRTSVSYSLARKARCMKSSLRESQSFVQRLTRTLN